MADQKKPAGLRRGATVTGASLKLLLGRKLVKGLRVALRGSGVKWKPVKRKTGSAHRRDTMLDDSRMMSAYIDELEKLGTPMEKQAILGFLGRGLTQIKGLVGLARKKGVGAMGSALKKSYQAKGLGGFAKKFAPAATLVGGAGLAAGGALAGTRRALGGRRD